MNEPTTISEATIGHLADLVECFDHPCVVEAPYVGQELHRRGTPCAVFTDRTEFEHLPGFRRWNLRKPIYLTDEFDFVVVAPDAEVRGPELYAALRVLCHFHYETPILVVVQPQRAARLSAALEPFDVRVDTLGEATVLVNFELP
jgi:hypothetical protein